MGINPSKKKAFACYYNTEKSETFDYNGEPYALSQNQKYLSRTSINLALNKTQ